MYKPIGKYEIRGQIGRGAMGVVFEAFDPVIERRVAIKTLRLEVFGESQLAGVRTRFKREAQSAGQMSHPHIVTVHDYGEHEGTPYIVMEYMTGSELSKVLERGTRLPLSEVVRLMLQLLGALAYAHERKVVHRDIKPGNLFILDDGSLKVVDFGIARVEASNLTDTGALLGTPAYMSPEQFLGQPVDERSDLYSAGVILYELLTGDKPFTGSVTTIMQKVLRQEPIEPSVLNPLLSNAWDAVTKRAMAKRPEARFQSARQFAETLKQFFASGAVDVSLEATLPGTGSTADLPGETPRRSPAAATPVSRISLMQMTAIGLAVAVVVGGGFYYSLRQIADERPVPETRLMVADAQSTAKAAEAVKAPMSRSAREAARDVEVAAKPLAAAKGQEIQVASSPPSAAGRMATPEAEALYEQALAMEGSGKATDAIRIYRRAARAGNGKAAKRLGDIYDKGVPGVSRDYAESLQWYDVARQLGEPVESRAAR